MSPASPSPDESVPVLTQLDVDRLLADPSADSRMHVLNRVYHHYEEEAFGEREHAVAEQIFRLLMKDVVIAVREALSQHIQHNPNIPRDIALYVSQDIESVAVPMLTHSPVLSDSDLVAIIEANSDLSKLLAITKREALSHRVSEALVEVKHPDVVESLVRNEKADISDQTYSKILEHFRGEQPVMQAMVDRAHIPLQIVQRLVHETSAAVAAQLKHKYKLSDDQLKKDTSETQEDVLLYLLANRVSEQEMHVLVTQMHVDHRLTPTLVMKGLCRGQLNFFTTALACLAGIPVENASRLLSDKGNLGFDGLYAKAGLPESMHAASYLVFQSVRELAEDDVVPGSRLYANRLAEHVLQSVGQENILQMPHFIALIRQPIQPH